ncbi:hypothetical protein B7494_g6134 [Chlorociboria aeruginascens]|nr:hypothetical protein B7494_g6134 [Chlorociboria aeruginascens]
MPPKPTNWMMLGKMAVAGLVCCIGGPALVVYLSPTEEQLFKKYNPELQKRSLDNKNKNKKQQEFDDFVGRLKDYSKSDKHIWDVASAQGKIAREAKILDQKRIADEIKARKEEIRSFCYMKIKDMLTRLLGENRLEQDMGQLVDKNKILLRDAVSGDAIIASLFGLPPPNLFKET